MLPDDCPCFQPLTGFYEPSGVRQLPDGRFIVVEDEEQRPLSLFWLAADGAIASAAVQLPAPPPDDPDFWRLDDLEAITLDQAGYLYAITSHSRDSVGDAQPAREKLVRFRIEGARVVEARLVGNLKRALTAAHPLLAAAARIREVKRHGGLNIEALEMSAGQDRLMVGFRSPLLDQRAIIACIENPRALFEAGEEARISPRLITLDLAGNGIRGLAHVPLLGGYLVIGGPVARERTQFALWFWSGEHDAAARRVRVAGLPGFEHAEGVTPALVDGRSRILLVSDDGSEAERRFASFLIVDPEQLQIER